MDRTALVAIGGNSLLRAGEATSVAIESAHVAETCRALAEVVSRGWRLVVTHGNGPQVGAALRRSELAAGEVYSLPLDLCVASTQGELGILLQQGLHEACRARAVPRTVATLMTQVEVAENDHAFARPTKPIGPFYSSTDAERLRRGGWTLAEFPPHGCRRLVASPEPLEVVEVAAIRALVDAGVVAVALGGGGVPVIRHGNRFVGVEAVVDKDLASALLAIGLRVDLLVMSTDVAGIYLNFGRPDARLVNRVSVTELRKHAAAGQFPPGTMGPKVEAIVRFMAAGGSEAIVTSPDRLVEAFDGQTGTHVLQESSVLAPGSSGKESLWIACGR